MSYLSDFSEKQNAYNDQMTKSLENIRKDVEHLNAQIERLKKSSGLDDNDMAVLDKMSASQEKLAKSLEEIDNLTAPEVPQAPNPDLPNTDANASNVNNQPSDSSNTSNSSNLSQGLSQDGAALKQQQDDEVSKANTAKANEENKK